MAANLSTRFLFGIKQGNTNPVVILSATIHTSNKPTLRRSDLYDAFECINNIQEAVTLFQFMIQMEHKPSVWHYSKLFKSIVKLDSPSERVKIQHYKHVIRMFKKLIRMGVPVNEFIMNTVINCYGHIKEVDLSFATIGCFLKRGNVPDIVTFTCMIKGLFIKGRVEQAVDMFKRLVKGKLYKVDEYTIATVLNGLCKSGNVDDAVQLLQVAEKNNWKQLNVVCYTTVIDGLCKAGLLRDAMDLLNRMIDRGIAPNVVTYNCFIYGLCMNGKLDFARTLFDDLPSKGITPEVITYTIMIQGFCKEGLFKDAREMLERMERIGWPPTSITYNVIIQGCLHHHHSHDSIKLLKYIVGREFRLDAPSFFVLLRQIRAMRQMNGIYDKDVIHHLTQKLVSSDAIYEMRDKHDEVMISSLMQKLNSSDR